MMRRVLAAAVIIVFSPTLAVATGRVGERLPFPPASVKPVDGGEVPTLEGRVVVLHVSASWCTPCLEDFPALARLQKKYSDRGLTVVTIAADELVTGAQFKKLVKAASGIRILHASPADDAAADWLKTFDMFPTTVLIDSKGIVRFRIDQRMTDAVASALTEEVAKLLLPAPSPETRQSAEVLLHKVGETELRFEQPWADALRDVMASEELTRRLFADLEDEKSFDRAKFCGHVGQLSSTWNVARRSIDRLLPKLALEPLGLEPGTMAKTRADLFKDYDVSVAMPINQLERGCGLDPRKTRLPPTVENLEKSVRFLHSMMVSKIVFISEDRIRPSEIDP